MTIEQIVESAVDCIGEHDTTRLSALVAEHHWLTEWKDHQEKNLLHYAAMLDSHISIPVLIGLGFNIDSKDKSGKTPLSHAARTGSSHACQALLREGAIVVPDDSGNFPIHYACSEGHLETVKTLVHHGNAINVMNDIPWSPLAECMLARYCRPTKCAQRLEIIKFLIGEGMDTSSESVFLVFQAAWISDICPEFIRFFIENGYPVDVPDSQGRLPIDCVPKEASDSVRLLIRSALSGR